MPIGTPAQMYLSKLQTTENESLRDIRLNELRRITGQDFGHDLVLWAEWIEAHSDDMGGLDNTQCDDLKDTTDEFDEDDLPRIDLHQMDLREIDDLNR